MASFLNFVKKPLVAFTLGTVTGVGGTIGAQFVARKIHERRLKKAEQAQLKAA